MILLINPNPNHIFIGIYPGYLYLEHSILVRYFHSGTISLSSKWTNTSLVEMVDQLTLQTIGILLTGLTVSIAAIYYTLTLRYTRRNQDLQLETRQGQLFMQIYSQWNSMEMGREYQRVMDSEWTDIDDFLEKHYTDIESKTGFRTVARFFEGIGVLVHRGLIDATFVDDLMSGATIRYWEKIAPMIKEWRIRYNWPQAVEWVEYLYNQVKPIVEEQHPELKT